MLPRRPILPAGRSFLYARMPLMNYKQFFLSELDREIPITTKMLSRFPSGKSDWKPHDKSMKIGDLAGHIAQLPNFVANIAVSDSYDMKDWKMPAYPDTAEELVKVFDEVSSNLRTVLEDMDEEGFDKEWSFMYEGKLIFALPKAHVIQSFFINHMVHHRAQLGVYLRLLDIPVPGTYGPSADEQ